MQQTEQPTTAGAAGTRNSEVPFGSNEVRLSPRQWLVALVLLAAMFHFIPILWQRIEPLHVTPDYRIPLGLGNDYWTYQRWCGAACRDNKTLVLGDSVVWGHFVSSTQTLSHYLNELAGTERFANVAIDGIHPVAMAGLVEHYGRDMSGKNVILSCNLLWMTSKDSDLQNKSGIRLNHPRLVPQVFPKIPRYQEPWSERIGVVVGREVPLFNWAEHVRIAYFSDESGKGLPGWTMEHPYANPAGAVTLELPSPDELPPNENPPDARPWTQRRLAKINPSWVELGNSLQWRLFQQTVATLRDRGSRVFVLVGPFNEHMLGPRGLAVYNQRKSEVEYWLRTEGKALGVAYYIPPALPSQYYADDCHPLAEGYALLAKQIFENADFRKFDEPYRK